MCLPSEGASAVREKRVYNTCTIYRDREWALDWVGGLHEAGCGAAVFLKNVSGDDWFCVGGIIKSEDERVDGHERKFRSFYLTTVFDEQGVDHAKADRKVSLDYNLFKGYGAIDTTRCFFLEFDEDGFAKKKREHIEVEVTKILPIPEGDILFNHRTLDEMLVQSIYDAIHHAAKEINGKWDFMTFILAPIVPNTDGSQGRRITPEQFDVELAHTYNWYAVPGQHTAEAMNRLIKDKSPAEKMYGLRLYSHVRVVYFDDDRKRGYLYVSAFDNTREERSIPRSFLSSVRQIRTFWDKKNGRIRSPGTVSPNDVEGMKRKKKWEEFMNAPCKMTPDSGLMNSSLENDYCKDWTKKMRGYINLAQCGETVWPLVQKFFDMYEKGLLPRVDAVRYIDLPGKVEGRLSGQYFLKDNSGKKVLFQCIKARKGPQGATVSIPDLTPTIFKLFGDMTAREKQVALHHMMRVDVIVTSRSVPRGRCSMTDLVKYTWRERYMVRMFNYILFKVEGRSKEEWSADFFIGYTTILERYNKNGLMDEKWTEECDRIPNDKARKKPRRLGGPDEINGENGAGLEATQGMYKETPFHLKCFIYEVDRLLGRPESGGGNLAMQASGDGNGLLLLWWVERAESGSHREVRFRRREGGRPGSASSSSSGSRVQMGSEPVGDGLSRLGPVGPDGLQRERSEASRGTLQAPEEESRTLEARGNTGTSTVEWALVTVYAPADPSSRELFFRNLIPVIPTDSCLVIMGDWNISLDEALKEGSRTAGRKDTAALFNLMQELELSDPYRSLNPAEDGFNWFLNIRRDLGEVTRRRLDYLLASAELVQGGTSISPVPHPLSDHRPVVADLVLSPLLQRGKGYFKLNSLNLEEPGLRKWVEEFMRDWQSAKASFDSAADWLDSGIAIISGIMDVSSRILARDRNREDATCRQRVEEAENRIGVHPISDLFWTAERERRMSEWEALQVANQVRWEENLKLKGIIVNDKLMKETFRKLLPSSSFHQVVELNHPFDSSPPAAITARELVEYARVYYADMLTSRRQGDTTETDLSQELDMWADTKVHLTTEERLALDRPVTLEELKHTLTQMAAGKCPGVDGLTVEFYKACWEAVGPALVEVYNEVLTGGRLGSGMTHGVISLMFKKGDKANVRNYRPISVLNMTYKVLAKTMVIRLGRVLPRLVEKDQGAFVQGRSIFFNILTAIESMEIVQSEHRDVAILLLDLERPTIE
ncbi:hypothetical protein CBR_g22108 [Chara braunii]|uniref:Endonuclease/exonuclease/phosphatase domain-containing protein n=1 Tax=Chara braunii TaxID=69332 RepID=A0A388L239_CHABU|nr:hypothetical protein CBR_g22108 [Chara braunii]|eukprot:GBG76361.1 hypothetical protein CBR_g22108 [Chara braunii]